jgi:hypothetical protein
VAGGRVPAGVRMLQKPSSVVLASLKASTYGRRRQGTYPLACDRSERFKRSLVCTSSASRSLRPCWASFFTHPLRSYLFVRSNSLMTCSVRSIVSLL